MECSPLLGFVAQLGLNVSTLLPGWCCGLAGSGFEVQCKDGVSPHFVSFTVNLGGTFPSFSASTALEWLEVGNNQLTGTIPSFSANAALEYADLRGNGLSGSIPSFSTNTALRVLGLSSNTLAGTIPSFSANTALEWLEVIDNELTGTIPSFSANAALEYAYLGENAHRDNSFFFFEYRRLDLAFNQLNSENLSGALFVNAVTVDLSHNQLSGVLPSFTECTRLSSLSLSSNQFTGAIPSFTANTALERLSLPVNQLTGAIPSFTANTALSHLDISVNKLTGTIPFFPPNIASLDLAFNQLNSENLSGALFVNAVTVDLSHNQLSGVLPSFTECTRLSSLSLSSNQFTGTLKWSLLPSTSSLDISSNMLTGALPSTLEMPLDFLVLANNKFTGNTPLYDVGHLNLMNNNLSGTLQVHQSMKELFLSGNQLSGTIPPNLDLINFYVAENMLTGSLPSFLEVWDLDVSNNMLSGTLPSFSTNFLNYLDVSKNKFSGVLPSFSQNAWLKALLGRDNDFSGPFSNFSNESQLRTLDLSSSPLGKVMGNSFKFDLPPSLVILNLSNASLMGALVNVSGRPDVFLADFSDNSISCPFPILAPSNVLLGKCNYDWGLYATAVAGGGGVIVFVGIASVFINRYSKKCSFSCKSKKAVAAKALLFWALGLVDVISDLALTKDILSTIEAPGPNCASVTEDRFFEYILPVPFVTRELAYRDLQFGYDTYAEFVARAQKGDSVARGGGSDFPENMQRNTDFMRDLCIVRVGQQSYCDFSQLLCVPVPGYRPHTAFHSAVLVALGVYACKEAAKVVALVVLACRSRSALPRTKPASSLDPALASASASAPWLDLRLGYFCARSVFSPVLALFLGPVQFASLALHDPSALDCALEVVYEGIENVPQVLIGLHYVRNVIRTDLSVSNLLSLSISAATTAWLLGNTFWLFRLKLKNKLLLLPKHQTTTEILLDELNAKLSRVQKDSLAQSKSRNPQLRSPLLLDDSLSF